MRLNAVQWQAVIMNIIFIIIMITTIIITIISFKERRRARYVGSTGRLVSQWLARLTHGC